MIIGIITAVLAAIADQISKGLIFSYLTHSGPLVEIFPFFNLVTAWNTGVSFSMFNNLGSAGIYILSGFSLFVALMLLCWLKKEQSRYMQIALGLIIGGALGNVIDRLRFGAVFDFLDVHVGFHHWPAFNLADSFICIGAVLVLASGLFIKKKPQA